MMLLGRPRQAALVLYREDGGATPDDPSLARGVPKLVCRWWNSELMTFFQVAYCNRRKQVHNG